MIDLNARIAENVAGVRGRMHDAADRSGRNADDVALVAVTKYVGEEEVRALVAAECETLGEARPQELVDKAPGLEDLPIHWHMIGHLQRNKVRRVLPLVTMIESVDRLRLAKTINRIAGELSMRVPVLLEVNISGDTAKHGFAPDAMEASLVTLAEHENIEVRGLMCMAGLETGLEGARADFAALRELRDRLSPNCPDGVALDELSMGMSRDYQIGVEEGATIVRVGTALYEGIL